MLPYKEMQIYLYACVFFTDHKQNDFSLLLWLVFHKPDFHVFKCIQLSNYENLSGIMET